MKKTQKKYKKLQNDGKMKENKVITPSRHQRPDDRGTFRKMGRRCDPGLCFRIRNRSGEVACASGSLHGGDVACAWMCGVLVRPWF